MLNFDLMETVAGQQIYDKGIEKGLDKGYLMSQDMLIGILKERFGVVPSKIIAQIRTIKQAELLENLPIQALRCPDMSSFKEKLSS